MSVIEVAVENAPDLPDADIVCSFQVGEHVSDVTAFAQLNYKLLKPGGVAVHRIDFGPHDIWRSYPDPLLFLRFPEILWRAMGTARGTPNRVRADTVVTEFKQAGLQVRIERLELYSADSTNITKVGRRYPGKTEHDLLTKAFVLIARKPL